MDGNLPFKNHMDTVKLKLNRENGLLAKFRYYINPKLLRTIRYAIYEFYLQYEYQLWGGKHNHKSYKILKKSKTKL